MHRNQEGETSICLSKPYIMGYMSVDGSREFHHDLSQLKFITSIPTGRLSYDLNHNIDKAIKRTTDENVEKIALLLRFLLDEKDRFEFLIEGGDPLGSVTFVSYRRTLISIMDSAFNPQRLRIVASLFNNCIYLCSMMIPDEVKKKKPCSDQENKYCAWGYKFEQYMTSDAPTLQPDIEKPVIENAEFSMYFCSLLGSHRLFYGAQIDGMLATSGVALEPFGTDVESKLNYLRSNSFVELKTHKNIQYRQQEIYLKQFKMLRSWCQCYLAGLNGLLMGYRNNEGIIEKLKWFNTADIVNYCKYEWDPQTTLDYLDYFLNYIKDSFKLLSKTSDSNSVSQKPFTLEFDIDVQQNIRVSTNVDPNIILPDWFVNNLNKKV